MPFALLHFHMLTLMVRAFFSTFPVCSIPFTCFNSLLWRQLLIRRMVKAKKNILVAFFICSQNFPFSWFSTNLLLSSNFPFESLSFPFQQIVQNVKMKNFYNKKILIAFEVKYSPALENCSPTKEKGHRRRNSTTLHVCK